MQVFLYWLATQTYFLAIRIAALFQPKARLAISGRKRLLPRIRTQMQQERRPRIWMHCASLGEFEQGRPVLEALKKEYPDYALVLTFFSPSGYEVRKSFEGVDYVFYLPFDSPGQSALFINSVKPELAIFVKYEYWYFLLRVLKQRRVPTLLIAAIFNKRQPFFKWYGGLYRSMLRAFTHLFVQDNGSLQLLRRLGITTATVAGDTRFDQVKNIASRESQQPIAAQFCGDGRPVLIAGSTFREDEQLLAEALKFLPAVWKLIIVPHEVDARHIKDMESRFDGNAFKWSDWQGGVLPDTRVLIVDIVGVLSQLYRYGRVAYIGGGFGAAGIHNILEAAVYGIPCVHGPVYGRFIEAVALLHAGGSSVVSSAEELVGQVKSWEGDPASYDKASIAAADYVGSRTGATAVVVDYLRRKKSLSSL